MHSVHRPELRPWIAPQTTTAAQFLEQCLGANVTVTADAANMPFEECLKQWDISAKTGVIDAIASSCDPATSLTCEPEESILMAGGNRPSDSTDWLPDVSLQSVQFLRQHPGCRAASVSYSTPSDSRPASRRPAVATAPLALQPANGMQVVVVVQVYRPIVVSEAKKWSVAVDMEMELLSCQTLLDMRRSISCVSDLSPDVTQAAVSNGAAYFLIGDTFYNDTRPGCPDYSQQIVAWSKDRGRGIGPFRSEDMSSVPVAELRIQIGYPYLYVHQGDCEHWIVFTDMRLLMTRSVSLSEYPKMKSLSRRHQVRCDLCRTNVSRWTTRNNMRMPSDPSFFCDECHRVFNFDAEGKAICSFKSQSYIDKSVMF